MEVLRYFVLFFLIPSLFADNRASIGSRWMLTLFPDPPVAPGMRLTLTLIRDSGCVNWDKVRASIATRDDTGKETNGQALLIVPMLLLPEDYVDCRMRDVVLPAQFPLGMAHIRASDGDGVDFPAIGVEVVKARFQPTTLSPTFDWLPVHAEHAGTSSRSRVELTHPATAGELIAIEGTGLGLSEASDVSVELGDLLLPAVALEHPAPGVDRVLVALPEEIALEGCYVPLRVVIDGGENLQVSPATLPVMPSPLPCRHPMGLTQKQLSALDSGNFVPVAHLTTSISATGPALFAVLDSRHLTAAEVAQIAGPQTPSQQAFGCHVLPMGSFNPREFGLSHPGGFFDPGEGLALEGPQGDKIPLVNLGYVFDRVLSNTFTAGEWKFLGERFHLPPPVQFTKRPAYEQLAAGNDAEIAWDASKYARGEVLVSEYTESKDQRTFLRCVVDATAGTFRLEASRFAAFGPPFYTMWRVMRRPGNPVAFPYIRPDSHAVGVVSFQAVP